VANRIEILPELVANKIAAGELVERPASVVMELVENSLDAEATEITVEVRAGGKRLIRVQDDGVGMGRDDSLLAFERFGTSKIRTAADLDNIATLGFRGEALASIASVAHVTLKTRERGAESGTIVVMRGGVLKKVEEVGCREGTLVEVSNLFYNTPARRAFLASTETEFFWVNQMVTQYALCRPEVRFVLTHNDRRVIDAAASDGLAQRIAAVLGPEVLSTMVGVSATSEELALKGHIGLPTKATASGRRLQSIFVNGRAVSSKSLQTAIYDAYRPYLMRGRHPALVLFLRVDPGQVNVNVHPTKRQVKFARRARVCQFVEQAVAETLRRTLRGPVVDVAMNLRAPPVDVSAPIAVDLARPHREKPQNVVSEKRERDAPETLFPGEAEREAQTATIVADEVPRPTAGGEQRPASGNRQTPLSSGIEGAGQVLSAAAAARHAQPVGEPGPALGLFGKRLVPVGQIDNSFIVAEGGGAVVIIDQHAAHERIYYEKFLRQVKLGSIPSQRLLMPMVLEMAPAVHDLLLSNRATLEPLGLELDDFGGGSIAVKSKPLLLSDDDVEQLVAEVGELMARAKKPKGLSFRPVEEMCALYACKAAIKANQPLSVPEMQELLDQLAKTEHPMTCPHGRPTTVELDLDGLRRSFLRSAKK